MSGLPGLGKALGHPHAHVSISGFDAFQRQVVVPVNRLPLGKRETFRAVAEMRLTRPRCTEHSRTSKIIAFIGGMRQTAAVVQAFRSFHPTFLPLNPRFMSKNAHIRDEARAVTAKPPAVILCEPQLGENIGTAARAMANFGLVDLRIVNPRDGWPSEKARAAASRADHVIDKVQVFDSVEAAIADLQFVFATTARSREVPKPVRGRMKLPKNPSNLENRVPRPVICSAESAGASTTRKWLSPTRSSRCRSIRILPR